MAKKKVVKSKQKQEKPTKKAKSNKSGWSIFQSVPSDDNDRLYRKIFWIAFTVISLLTLIMAVNTGVNEDEKFHYSYVDGLMDYYGSGGEKKDILDLEFGKIVLYGGFVDILTGVGNKILGFEQGTKGYGAFRHIIIGLIGLLAFLFAGLLGKRIGGWRVGILAMIILFLSPRFLGHSGINPRDLPFASGYIMSIYFMVKFFGEIPKVSWKTVVGLGAGLALAFATRSGGLLLFAYLGLFGLIHMWRTLGDKRISNQGLFASYLKFGALASALGYGLALLFWPYGLAAPIKNVMQSLTEFSNYTTVLRMLFAGDMSWSTDISTAKYMFTWLGIGLPLILLLGVIIFIAFSKGIFKRSNKFYVGMVCFAFVFPVLYILYKQSNLYCGLRHMLFLIPPLAVMAGLGFDYALRKFENTNNPVALAIGGIMAILALLPLSHIALNFRTTYVYFNELAGGVKGALGNYELDYWGVSQKAAVEWMEDQGYFDGDEPIRVRANSLFVARQYINKYEHVKSGYARFRERYEKDWDYAIFINHLIDGAQIRTGKYLDKNVVKVIGKGDTPFCMIYKNSEERLATKGYEALKAQNYDQAISLFEREVADNEYNENAWQGLGKAYFAKQNLPKAESAFKKVLELSPESQVATSYLSLAYINQNKLDEALPMLDDAIERNEKDVNSRYYRAMIRSRKGNQSGAIADLRKNIETNHTHRQSYQLLIQIYQQMGDQQNVSYFQQLMQQFAR